MWPGRPIRRSLRQAVAVRACRRLTRYASRCTGPLCEEASMPFWISEGGESGSCADSRIVKAMHFYSQELFSGCEHFARLSASFGRDPDIRMANSAAIFFGVSAIEARINEDISASIALEEGQGGAWSELEKKHRRSPLSEKWNAVSQIWGGEPWSAGREPFQSFVTVCSLRNELIHYKGELLGKDEAPNRSIYNLMRKLGVASQASFTGDDCSSWVSDLLGSPSLGPWVSESVSSLWNSMYDLLHE